MKARLLGVALLATMALAACGDDDNDPQPQGRLRAIHLSPDAPAVDVKVNGNQVLANVTYLVGSDYLDVPAGTINVKVEPVGSDAAVIDANVPVADGTDYTVLAVNYVADIEPLYLTDDNAEPTAGSARVRIVHAAPSAGNVDVYFAPAGGAFGVPSLTNFPFKGVSTIPGAGNYITVPAGNYTVRVTAAGNPTAIAIEQAITIPAGAVVTAVAVENTGGGEPFSIEAYVDATY
jgi:hypothetical protein